MTMINQSSLWVSLWSITWLTTVPLFHIHLPDISSSRQAAQIGVAHTVFSPDLPGEFSRVPNAKPDPLSHLSHWVFNSPELGFVLSEGSKDREKGKPLALGIRGSLPDEPFMPSSAIEFRKGDRQRLAVAILRCPRAPPSVVSS